MSGSVASMFSSLTIRPYIVLGWLMLMSTTNLWAAKTELPSWEKEDERKGITLGGMLFPTGAAPKYDGTSIGEDISQSDTLPMGEDVPEEGTTSPEGTPPTRTPVDVDAIALPEGMIPLRIPLINTIPIVRETQGEVGLPPIEGALRDEYFSTRPVDYLIDPQHLLTEQKKNDLARFLEYHSEEARYHIYVIVLGETQSIPDDIDLIQLQRDWFQSEEAVLVTYFLGKPELAITGFNTRATTLLPQEIFDRVQQYCVAEAQIASDSADQIERFMIELSTRLWWVAKLIERQSIKGTALSAADAEVEMSKPDWETASSIETIAPPGFDTEHEESAQNAAAQNNTEFNLMTWLLAVLVLLIVGLGTGFATWIWRRDAITSQPVLFPDRELPSRLGGQFSGGGHIGISFAMEGEE